VGFLSLPRFHLKTDALQSPECCWFYFEAEAVYIVQNFIHVSLIRDFFFWKEKVTEIAKNKKWP